MRVLLEAPILTKSGYGEHARLVYKALSQNPNLDIFINPLNWGTCSWETASEDVFACINKFRSYHAHCENSKQKQEYSLQVHVGIPNEFQRKAPFSVCVTAGIETDRVSANWLLKTYNDIDKIIVPSNHAKSGFVNTGYEVLNQANNTKTHLTCACPVDVIHYPVKSPEGPGLEIDFQTDFNFLQIAMIGPRKNMEQSIKCFVEQFKDNENVGLIIKTSLSKSTIIDRQATKKQIENYVESLGEKKCKVYLIHGNLTESEMHSLYTHPKVKAYYTTTHGEGYGLPIFEAAYSGLPVIATDWSGHLDFLSAPHKGKTKKLFAKISCDIKQVQQKAVWGDLILKESRWAFPKDSSIKTQISNVYKNYGMYRGWAKTLQQHIVENYKLENILDQYNVSIFGKSKSSDIDISALKTEALAISNVKERAKFAKEVMSGDLSQTDKIEFLKDLFKGEKAHVLSCGPTLTDHDPEKVRELLKDSLGVSIKQSFDLFGDMIDFHIYNCANYKEYDYSENKPVVIEASSTPYRLGECDLKFFIQERDFNNSVAVTGDFDSWTFEKQPLLRPYGPGIMYEVVFYTLQHLGVSEVITIGWDNKLIQGTAGQQHFYDKEGSDLDKSDFIHSNEVAANQAAVATLNNEATITADAMLGWYGWLKSQGTELKIISKINPAPEQIERIAV